VKLTDAELLAAIGLILHGAAWRVPLLQEMSEIGVPAERFATWEAGQNKVPAEVWAELLELLEERDTEIAELRARVTVRIAETKE
jgi:hypothetical protein